MRFSGKRFLNLSTTDFGDQIILCSGGLSCELEMPSSVPVLHPLDASSTTIHPSSDNQRCFQSLPGVRWGAKLSPGENRSRDSHIYEQPQNLNTWQEQDAV